ncbi:MAG: DEAD/DEAH box helicase, partial [Deltaproteobacteria bacterium]|nr:DEAD/DEAH box helicase [Deltaproteobacteria bacterium]
MAGELDGLPDDSAAPLLASALKAVNETILSARKVKLTRSQHVMFLLADMMVWAEVGRALCRKSAASDDNTPGPEYMKAVARLFAGEVLEKVYTNGIKIAKGCGHDLAELTDTLASLNSDYRRPKRPAHDRRLGGIKKGDYDHPRIDPQLKHTFQKIGVPAPIPFQPDPFQVEALDKIEAYDVLVSAPTGAGKTWIASQAITRYLTRGLRIWYASPLKALSNAIYLQFCREFGTETCGILTGDRKENPGAPVIVGTTEILRNQLYDAMHQGTSIQADLVILDEAHYISDPDRGVVWEEVLIYLHGRVKLLLLSATISNAEEIGEWLEENRGTGTHVVRSYERPVPLDMLFLFPDGLITSLAGKKGLAPRVKKFVTKRQNWRRRGSGKIRFGDVIRCLRDFDLLPAIFFLKSRTDCDRALISCAAIKKPIGDRERIKQELKSFLRKYPHLEGHRQIRPLVEYGVGSHHAGQLPYWKVLIENMMNKGYLDAIFSTSTVAAGVNFPARTVVLVQSDRYNGHEFADLTATDLHQMTGRAGRRGKDNIGFALIIPGIHQDPQLIYELRDSLSEPLRSQIHINFSMALNLLLSHTPEEVKVLLNRSFAAFQERKSGSLLQKKWAGTLKELKSLLPDGQCDVGDPYEIIETIGKRKEIKAEIRARGKDIRYRRRLKAMKDYLQPGRLFLHKNGHVYALWETHMADDRLVCTAFDIKKGQGSRKRRRRLKNVDPHQIKALFNHRVDLDKNVSVDRLDQYADTVSPDDLVFLDVTPSEKDIPAGDETGLRRELELLPCESCPHRRVCHGMKSNELKKILRRFQSLANQIESLGGGLWVSFKRHV